MKQPPRAHWKWASLEALGKLSCSKERSGRIFPTRRIRGRAHAFLNFRGPLEFHSARVVAGATARRGYVCGGFHTTVVGSAEIFAVRMGDTSTGIYTRRSFAATRSCICASPSAHGRQVRGALQTPRP